MSSFWSQGNQIKTINHEVTKDTKKKIGAIQLTVEN